MKLKQWHYTSCEYGLSGRGGYQTRAKSEGISEQEQRILEGIGEYRQPIYDDPDSVDIADHPIAFRSNHVVEGQLAIVRSTYTGRDYTNRSGNFFAHGLLCQADDIHCRGIDVCLWGGWMLKLSPEDDQPQDSYQLEDVGIKIPTGFAFDVLADFLNKDQNRLNYLKQMLVAVLSGKTNGRKLVLRCHSWQESLYWLACIQKAFALNYQPELSFSSYQFDLHTEFALNVVYDHTDFVLDNTIIEHQFYVFDFVGQQFSTMPTIDNPYIDYIADCFAHNVEQLNEFYDFAEYFSHQLFDDGLITLLTLYQARLGNIQDISTNDVLTAIRFIHQYVLPECTDKIAIVVEKLTERIMQNQQQLQTFYVELVHCLSGGQIVENGSFQTFLQHLIEKKGADSAMLDWLFAPFASDLSAFGRLLNVMTAQLTDAQVLKQLATWLHQKLTTLGEEPGLKVIKALMAGESGRALAIREWALRIQNQDKPIECFKHYKARVFAHNADLSSEQKAPFYREFWLALTDIDKADIAQQWLKSGEDELLPAETLALFYQFVNDNIPLTAEKSVTAQFKRDFRQKVEVSGIKLSPNTLYLRERIEQKDQLSVRDTKQTKAALEGISEENYQTFLTHYFAPGLATFRTDEQHKNLFKNSFCGHHEPTLLVFYHKKLKSNSNKTLEPTFYIMLRFWLSFERSEQPWATQYLHYKTLQILEDKCFSLHDNVLNKISEKLSKEPDYQEVYQAHWNAMLKDVERRKNSWVGYLYTDVIQLIKKAIAKWRGELNNG